MENNSITTTTTTTTATATTEKKTPATTAKKTPATPARVTTVKQEKMLRERNAESLKSAKNRAVESLKKLYHSDPVAGLSACFHRDNMAETPILSTYNVVQEKTDSDGNVTRETVKKELPIRYDFFAPAENRKAIRDLMNKLGLTATASAVIDRTTAGDALENVREIARLAGFPTVAPRLNESHVIHILTAGRYTTGRGNAQFDTARAGLALFGALWSIVARYQTTDAFKAHLDEIERKRAEKKESAKKTPAKKTAKKTPAKKTAKK